MYPFCSMWHLSVQIVLEYTALKREKRKELYLKNKGNEKDLFLFDKLPAQVLSEKGKMPI